MKNITNCINSLIFFFSLIGFNNAAIADNATSEFVLSNGLKLIVREDHRAPVALFQIWYKVGASYETGGQTGLSHVLEHLMFKGTRQYPDDSFSKIIAANGGNHNAMTSSDFTVYYETLGQDRIELSFKLEADRMRNLTLNKEDIIKELEVIKEERRMRVDDRPSGKLFERFKAAAYLSSGYHHPTIGWMEDINSYTIPEIMDWYAKWYHPNNAFIVIVGDVNPEQMHEFAQKYFAPIPKQTLAPHKIRPEQEQIGERRVTVEMPAKLPSTLMGYITPSIKTAKPATEAYSLYLLSTILSGSNMARIDKNIVRDKQLAVSAGSYYEFDNRFAAGFMLYGTPSPNTPTEKLEQALRQETLNLTQKPVSKSELDIAKATLTAQMTFAKDSLSAQAMTIGSFEVIGLDWRLEKTFIQNIQALQNTDLLQVAKQYFNDKRLTVATLKPLST